MRRRCLTGVTLLILLASSCASHEEPLGPFARWERIEIAFEGPDSEGLGDPNPFSLPLDVVFTSPEGRSYAVPGFYDGDGRGSLDGNVWKVRFAADSNGPWTWQTQSREAKLDGGTGRFEVVDPPADAAEFYRLGRLEYVDRPYLKFREGGYWLKAGADEPENILGNAFGLDDWASKKRQIDYLSQRDINSIYVMTHTLEGDENDVWPWVGSTPEEAKKNSDRFDVARLEKWRDFFEYAQSKGIVIQLVLEDDSAWTGYDHATYYREMVARFGYLPAVYFNVGEEYNENYSLEQAIGYMELLGEIDPYDHPRAIHNVRIPTAQYIDSPALQVTSIQTWPAAPATLNQLAIDWRQACLARGQRPLVVSFDEARPAEDRRSWWSVLLGGGVWEGLVPVPQGYPAVEPVWKELAAARAFMETLAFEKMFPANHLVVKGSAFCLAKPGEAYALYLPKGGSVEVELGGEDDTRYGVEWFDPRTGEFTQHGPETLAAGRQLLQAPDNQDWAVKITRTQGSGQAAPTAASARVRSVKGQPVSIHLALLDADAPGSYECRIVREPRSGSLTGSGTERVYTPRADFTGQDHFEWQALGDGWQSNVATVVVFANASGENTAPRVEDSSVTVSQDKPRSFILEYADPDGPGPYEVRIRKPPRFGKAEGADNDITYAPNPGFTGRDEFEWEVSDGLSVSRRAKTTLVVR